MKELKGAYIVSIYDYLFAGDDDAYTKITLIKDGGWFLYVSPYRTKVAISEATVEELTKEALASEMATLCINNSLVKKRRWYKEGE